MYRNYIKCLIDKILALIILVVLLPVILLVMLFLLFEFGTSVIFTQSRPGKSGKIFKIYKFRTMNSKTDSCGNLLPDMQRITNVGKLIRQLSIDELPQLFNVLKGEMSLIGPRPLLVEYLEKYTQEQARRHEVKPGITGWAQVNGRNGISWDEKFKLDVWYVDNISFLLDIKIVLMTFLKVIKRESVNAGSDRTMYKFNK